jgi:hypothetical protein
MKKLLILPLLVLLTGCVTYYYPQTALEDGVYYAEDDPSYNAYSDSYAGVSYYPWSSLDYFYLGYNPYPRYGFSYGYGGGFSFGISYGYSPWYYPSSYCGYYSPWYASHYHYPYYPAWRPYNGYCSRHNGCHHKNKKNYRGDGHDRYTGNDHNGRRDRAHEDEDENRRSTGRDNERRQVGGYGTSRVSRHVSTAPSGYSGNRGMVIRNRESTKTGKSRLEPVKSKSVQPVKVTTSTAPRAQPKYRTRRTGNEVRYSSGAKQTRSRTGPVEASPSSKNIAIATPSSPVRVSPGNSGGNRQSGQTNTTRQVSGQPPSRSESREGSASRQPASSGNSTRSRPNSSASTSSSSRNRGSEQRNSSRHERRN